MLYLDSFLLSIPLMLCFAHECVHGKYCVVLFCGSVCLGLFWICMHLVKIIVGKHFWVYFLGAEKAHPLKLEFLTSKFGFFFFLGVGLKLGVGTLEFKLWKKLHKEGWPCCYHRGPFFYLTLSIFFFLFPLLYVIPIRES